jgi:hypothetical protein
MFGRWSAPVAAALLTLCAARAQALEGPEIQWRGLLDVALAERGKAYELNLLTRGDASFDAYGLRLFADGEVGERLQIFGQIVLRDASGLYVEGAYATFTPDPERDLHLLAGKLPWAIGTYAPRSYSNRNPLVGTPLMYQYHSTLVWYALPPNADALLAEAGSGQHGVGYAYGGFGMPLVDDSYWDVGFTFTGSQRPLEYAAGMVMGTPGWGVTGQDDNAGKSFLGRVGLAPTPSLGSARLRGLRPLPPDRAQPAASGRQDRHRLPPAPRDADLEPLAATSRCTAKARSTWETPGGDQVAAACAGSRRRAPVQGAGRHASRAFRQITDSAGGAPRRHHALETGIGYKRSRDREARLPVRRRRARHPAASTPNRWSRPSSDPF